MSSMTPKARLYHVYPGGQGLRFETKLLPSESLPGELFKTSAAGGTFRCTLYLPDGNAIDSDIFSRKKDAEQDAAQRALDKMTGTASVPETLQEKWESLLKRTADNFCAKRVLTNKPLVAHFRAAVQRKGQRYGQVPASVVVTFDTKINNICKSINRATETMPSYALAIICQAASLCPSLNVDIDNLCISRAEPFTAEVEQELLKDLVGSSKSVKHAESEKATHMHFMGVYIPASTGKMVTSYNTNLQPEEYYLDILARKLNVGDGGKLLISRVVGKFPADMRLYWATPEALPKIKILETDLVHLKGEIHQNDKSIFKGIIKEDNTDGENTQSILNYRASTIAGIPIHGDAILASVGCSWKSEGNLFSNDVTLSCYSRLFVGKFPEGCYKVSRGAILAAKLPTSFSSRAQWRGMMPRSILSEALHHRHLPEPIFFLALPNNGELAESFKTDRLVNKTHIESCPQDLGQNNKESRNSSPISQLEGPFQYSVTVEWEKGFPRVYDSDGGHRTQGDAIQSAALNALHHSPSQFGETFNFRDGIWVSDMHTDESFTSSECNTGHTPQQDPIFKPILENDQFGLIAPAGSFVTVHYVAFLLEPGSSNRCVPILVEKVLDFEFELGIGAVIAPLDALVAKMHVEETVTFYTSVPSTNLLLAISDEFPYDAGRIDLQSALLKYSVKLVKFVEPQEERMEAAFFKPSLSKQRMEFALSLIRKLQAKSLVDLGCGSGSLLEYILEKPTDLVDVAGVDISMKGLSRAAKSLYTKLSAKLQTSERPLKKLTLYEGSIADLEPVLYGFDLATCIEVVEHMDPEPLSRLGKSILGGLCPKVLLVSTPNFEYNPLLQRTTWDPLTNSLLAGLESATRESPDSGTSAVCTLKSKLRNDDHRFEWTRAQFRIWAGQLADDFGYYVEFDGVGGSGDEDGPGFASQIAIFTKKDISLPLYSPNHTKSASHATEPEISSNGHDRKRVYTPVWEWRLAK